MVPQSGFEPASTGYEPDALTIELQGHKILTPSLLHLNASSLF